MSTCQPPQHQCKNRYKHCPWNGLDVFRLWPLLLFIFSLNIWTANPKETCPCLQKHQTVETRVLHKNSQRVSHWATPSRRQGLKVLGLHSHHAAAQAPNSRACLKDMRGKLRSGQGKPPLSIFFPANEFYHHVGYKYNYLQYIHARKLFRQEKTNSVGGRKPK